MTRRKRNAQYNAAGCKVCGNPKIGRGIAKHLLGAHHGLKHADYKKCFSAGKTLVDRLSVTGFTLPDSKRPKKVVIHTLVRRFTISNRH